MFGVDWGKMFAALMTIVFIAGMVAGALLCKLIPHIRIEWVS